MPRFTRVTTIRPLPSSTRVYNQIAYELRNAIRTAFEANDFVVIAGETNADGNVAMVGEAVSP